VNRILHTNLDIAKLVDIHRNTSIRYRQISLIPTLFRSYYYSCYCCCYHRQRQRWSRVLLESQRISSRGPSFPKNCVVRCPPNFTESRLYVEPLPFGHSTVKTVIYHVYFYSVTLRSTAPTTYLFVGHYHMSQRTIRALSQLVFSHHSQKYLECYLASSAIVTVLS
jgi:hypothetical protein